MGVDTTITRILRPPQLRTGEKHSASWPGPFFDLVFVIAISHLAFALAKDQSAVSFARFFLLFGPVRWSCTGYTNDADRLDADAPIFRGMALTDMLAMAALAVTISDAFGGAGAVALSYAATRITPCACGWLGSALTLPLCAAEHPLHASMPKSNDLGNTQR